MGTFMTNARIGTGLGIHDRFKMATWDVRGLGGKENYLNKLKENKYTGCFKNKKEIKM
jgi:hypothetical protein